MHSFKHLNTREGFFFLLQRSTIEVDIKIYEKEKRCNSQYFYKYHQNFTIEKNSYFQKICAMICFVFGMIGYFQHFYVVHNKSI